jgi:hypothetical protein
MIAPEPWLAAPPALTAALLVGDGRLGVSRTGKPAGCYALDGLGNALGLFGLGSAVGGGRLLGSLTGVYDEKTEGFHREAPLSVCHFDPAPNTAPMPAPGGFLPRPPRFFEEQRPWVLLLAPRL